MADNIGTGFVTYTGMTTIENVIPAYNVFSSTTSIWFYGKTKEEEEREKWIEENVYHREILFEKTKKGFQDYFNISGCTTFYSGSTHIDLTLGTSSRGIGNVPIYINNHSEFVDIFVKLEENV
jgi:hypothetical protein